MIERVYEQKRVAGIYVRISGDPTGRRLGVTRQRSACEDGAKKHGWRVHRVYEDNDISAYSGKPRPQYEQMLDDLEAGVIDAVVVWDLDRLTRRPIEIEHFIELADRRGIALASIGGDVDLATDNGRMFARIKGAVARAEVERKSARQRAANEQRRAAGRMHVGRRAFGYSTDGSAIVDAYAAGDVDELQLRRVSTRLRGDLDQVTTELASLSRRPAVAALLEHDDLETGWKEAVVDEQRAILASLATIRLHSPGRGARRFDPATVGIEWR